MTSFMLKEAKRTWAQIHQNLNYPSYISNKKNKFKDTMVFLSCPTIESDLFTVS